MTDGTALREIAAEILTEILEKGQYADSQCLQHAVPAHFLLKNICSQDMKR